MRLIFVCSGNTCRSPLALAAWQKCAREWPELSEIEAESAGICPREGERAATFARQIAHSWGADLSNHQARLFTLDDAQSDLILTFTGDQAQVLRGHFGLCEARVKMLGEFAPDAPREIAREQMRPLWGKDASSFPVADAAEHDILDPFGGSREAYNECASQIEIAVRELAQFLAKRAFEAL